MRITTINNKANSHTWSIQQRKIKRRLPMLKRKLFPRCRIPPKSLHHCPSSHPSSAPSFSLPPHPQSDKHATSPGKWQIPSVTMTCLKFLWWTGFCTLTCMNVTHFLLTLGYSDRQPVQSTKRHSLRSSFINQEGLELLGHDQTLWSPNLVRLAIWF